MSRRETSSEIDIAAADWATRLDHADLDTGEQAEFDGWLRGDIRRVGAFARAQAVLVHIKRAKALGSEFEPGSFRPEGLAAGNVEAIADYDPPVPQSSGLSRRQMLAGATAVAAIGAAALFIPARSASARVYETGRGETRLVPLGDGSTVTLNTDTRIMATIGRGQRTIELVRGEALIQVAAGNRADFLVEVDETALRTQDARFSVCRLDALSLTVEVCEGQVEVERSGPATGEKRLLEANTQAVLPRRGTIVARQLTAAAIERELAWQEGMLSFEDTPLRVAAAEFARYSNRRIVIADSAVGAETVTGRYSANDPEGFARAVALSLGLQVQPASSGVMLAR